MIAWLSAQAYDQTDRQDAGCLAGWRFFVRALFVNTLHDDTSEG